MRREPTIVARARATKAPTNAPPCSPGAAEHPPESSEGASEPAEHASRVSPASFVQRSAWHTPEVLPYVQASPTFFPEHADMESPCPHVLDGGRGKTSARAGHGTANEESAIATVTTDLRTFHELMADGGAPHMPGRRICKYPEQRDFLPPTPRHGPHHVQGHAGDASRRIAAVRNVAIRTCRRARRGA